MSRVATPNVQKFIKAHSKCIEGSNCNGLKNIKICATQVWRNIHTYNK